MLAEDEDRAYYGPGHVKRAAELGAIQQLLIVDELFREQSPWHHRPPAPPPWHTAALAQGTAPRVSPAPPIPSPLPAAPLPLLPLSLPLATSSTWPIDQYAAH